MKNVWPVFRYHFFGVRNVLFVFYGLVLLFCLVLLLPENASGIRISVDGNLGNASFIFLFIVGLNSFKEGYLFFQTNNVTRKAVFWGTCLGLSSLALLMALLDTLIAAGMSLLIPLQPLAGALYGQAGLGFAFFWSFSLLFASALLGWLVTLAFYRCNTPGKILLSLSPLLLVFLYASLSRLTDGRLTETFTRSLRWALGFSPAGPGYAVLTFILFGLLALGIIYLLIRKAPQKPC